jgi:hypothetical protein
MTGDSPLRSDPQMKTRSGAYRTIHCCARDNEIKNRQRKEAKFNLSSGHWALGQWTTGLRRGGKERVIGGRGENFIPAGFLVANRIDARS